MLNVELARERRERLQRTQAQLAEQIGVDHTTLCKWEGGQREPRSAQLVAWAEALGLEVADLFAGTAAAARKGNAA